MGDLWGYDENNDVEQLGQRLLLTTLELEKLQSEAAEEMRRNKECIDQLINHLKRALQERDEARSQLLSLGKANSSVTESNSLSETCNYHGEPVDSLFDGPSSDILINAQFVAPPKIDQASLFIDNIAKGRALPQRGRFLQALRRAGPLLQTLLVSGPLPRWRNPPQFQPFQVPPTVSVKAREVGGAWPDQIPATNGLQAFGPGYVPPSSPMLNYAEIMPNYVSPAGMNGGDGYAPLAKRQRFI